MLAQKVSRLLLKNVYTLLLYRKKAGKKEREKVAKYTGLRVELERMWGMNAETVPFIVGGLGAITRNLGDELSKIPGSPDRFMCQKISLLGSKKILQDVLRRRR